MRTSESSRPAAAAATSTPGTAAQTADAPPKAAKKGAASPDAPLVAGSARFAAESRAVAAGVTARGPATVQALAKPSFVTLDAVSLIAMAKSSISAGSFNATVPMRAGAAKFPSGKEELADMLIGEGTVCTLDAKLIPSDGGPQLTDVMMTFDPPMRLQNPGIFIGGALANKMALVHVTGIGFDKEGQMLVEGTFKLPFLSPKPLSSLISADALLKLDLHLEAFLSPGRAPSLPKLPGLDPRQLLATLGGVIDKASFNLVIEGPQQTLAVAGDGAEILSAEGRGSLKLNGELTSSDRVLTGNVSGSLNAGVKLGIELDGKDGAIRADGLTIMQREGRLLALAGDTEIRRIAGPVAVLIGDGAHLDAQVAGTVNHAIAIRISEEGALSITLNQVEAVLELNEASATGPRFKVALGAPSTASFKLAELSVGETGIVARNAEGQLDLTVAEGSVEILGSTQTVKQGRLSVSAQADAINGNAGAKVAYDIPLLSQFPDGRRGESRAAGTFETKISR